MKSNFVKQVLHPLRDAIQNFPDRNAFCINEQNYTYRDFACCISGIYNDLLNRRFFSENIGLVVNDDIETYASIFALWLAGKSYVPLHPNQPLERCNDIINQISTDLILDSSKSSRYPQALVLSTCFSVGGIETDLPFDNDVPDETLAYILFTSGSTGKPKGVQITRGNIAAFMDAFWKTGILINESDRCLQCFDLTFDVSVQSYLVPLTRGACTYTIPHDQIKYSYVYGLLEEHELTFGAMAPSMLRYLRPYFDEIECESMRYCIVTAEASPDNLIREWSRCIPHADIYDFYGPTEATIYCTYYKVPEEQPSKTLNGMLSIGRPLPGMTALIVDENLEILPLGEKGELCMAGPQLTPGYWNNPEKNREVFFEKEYQGETLRFYHTGDLCYFDTDGDIMYSGRLDFQAKIQGYRVELGEIEFHAREYLKGKNVIAVAFENTSGNTEIALFIEGYDIPLEELTAYLRSKMPPYMIPTCWKFVLEFPLNANGKIDRNQLRAFL